MNFDWERLAAGVHRTRLPFQDVTVGLIEAETGAMLIDTGTTLTEAAAIDADVRAITGQRVNQIVLTHKHFDHILGASAFTGAEIHCTPEVAEYMSAPEQVRADALPYGVDAAELDRSIAAMRTPDHTINDADVDLGGRSLSIRHLGCAHTNADSIVVVPPVSGADRTVVFCGDLVEESDDPAIDADSDVAAWAVALDRVLDAGGPNSVYVPGHGAVVDAAFIRRQQDWLRARLNHG